MELAAQSNGASKRMTNDKAQNPIITKARKKTYIFNKKEILMGLRAARQVRHVYFARDRKVMN